MKADAVAALATSIQTGIVAVAAGIAWWQVRESRKLREAQAQPYVVVSLEQDPNVRAAVNLVIRNIGTTVARDVRLSFEPPLVSSLDEPGSDIKVTDWQALKGIPSLVPGQSMSTLFDLLITRYEGMAAGSKYPTETEVTVTYMGEVGKDKQHRYTYLLDFSVFHNGHSFGTKNLNDGVEELEKISNVLKSWDERGSLRTLVKGLDESREERAAQYKEYLERRKSPGKEAKADGQEPATEPAATPAEAPAADSAEE